MKTILLTQRLSETPEYGEIRQCLDIRWGELIAQAGFLPLAAPLGAGPRELAFLPNLAGIILTGGDDLSSLSDSPLSSLRDDFESALVDAAQGLDLPILGVCRGAQFLAQRHGSQLRRVGGHAGTTHGLEIVHGSDWAWMANGKTQANSFHNWAIATTPPGCGPAAKAPDATIEAFGHGELPHYGIMWHPERDTPFHSNSITLLLRIFGS